MTNIEIPVVGTPATIHLYTDSVAAVVVRVCPKSVVIDRVAVLESSRRQINPGEPFPCLAWDGDLSQPLGRLERFTLRSDGSYRNGSIRLTLGRSVKVTDYRH